MERTFFYIFKLNNVTFLKMRYTLNHDEYIMLSMRDDLKEFINESLNKYISENPYPWHMPGHKRRACHDTGGIIQNEKDNNRWTKMFAYDFTEAKGLDDMHKPEAFIKDSMQELCDIYGTYKTYMLVNGATAGILAAVYACCNLGETILMARNCHKSVYHAVSLLRLKPEYLQPSVLSGTGILGDITPAEVDRQLDRMKAKGEKPSALILTSPTYEGIVSDIQEISNILMKYDIPLIVDEAHGAHLAFMGDDYPTSAIYNGADFVIESVHKTLPSLTQTAVLHLMNKKYEKNLEKYLSVFQTSSPSYLFMQSIEKAVCYCYRSVSDFKRYRSRLENFRNQCEDLKHLSLFYPHKKVYDYDIGKLVIQIGSGAFFTYESIRKKLTGTMLSDILAEEYGQVLEMASKDYVIAMTSVMDSDAAFANLYHALKEIDSRIVVMEQDKICPVPEYIPDMGILPGEAWNRDSILMELEQSKGRMAAEYIYAYPPGIPVVVPGELISEKVISDIRDMLKCELSVTGVYLSQETIRIAVIGG